MWRVSHQTEERTYVNQVPTMLKIIYWLLNTFARTKPFLFLVVSIYTNTHPYTFLPCGKSMRSDRVVPKWENNRTFSSDMRTSWYRSTLIKSDPHVKWKWKWKHRRHCTHIQTIGSLCVHTQHMTFISSCSCSIVFCCVSCCLCPYCRWWY